MLSYRLPNSSTGKPGILVAPEQWQRAGEILGLDATTSSKLWRQQYHCNPLMNVLAVG